MKAIFIVVLFLSDDARCEGLSELFPRVRGTEIRGLQGMPLASKILALTSSIERRALICGLRVRGAKRRIWTACLRPR